MSEQHTENIPRAHGTAWEVFLTFLRLGMTSFGGPIAHLGYFRSEVVERRKWMQDQEFADLVALCQFLPGPASSQVGFAIGLHRAGVRGALAAFLAFTLPSAALMVAFAHGTSLLGGTVGEGLLNGLKIVAVSIIAQAVLGMSKNLAPDRLRALIAGVSVATALLIPGSFGQITGIVIGAIVGLFFCGSSDIRGNGALHFPIGRRIGVASLTLFVVLLLGTPLLVHVSDSEGFPLFNAFYRAGSLVFGGGHVVLPLLQTGVVDTGWVTNQEFLTGYGAAQAVPGPLFTFAAFLGAVSQIGPGGVPGAAIALVAIFLPGFLFLVGVLPMWNTLLQKTWAQAVMRGVNAAVVGILAAALYTPVFTTSIVSGASFSLAVICFVSLVSWKLPPWMVVIAGAAGGVGIQLAGLH